MQDVQCGTGRVLQAESPIACTQGQKGGGYGTRSRKHTREESQSQGGRENPRYDTEAARACPEENEDAPNECAWKREGGPWRRRRRREEGESSENTVRERGAALSLSLGGKRGHCVRVLLPARTSSRGSAEEEEGEEEDSRCETVCHSRLGCVRKAAVRVVLNRGKPVRVVGACA